MRFFGQSTLLLTLILVLVACSTSPTSASIVESSITANGETPTTQESEIQDQIGLTSTMTTIATTEIATTPESTEPELITGREANAMPTLTIQVGNQTFTAELYDNASTRAWLNTLPQTLTMSDLHRNEKFYDFPQALPSSSERVGRIETGDLMLYGSRTLVLFYESFGTQYSYTRLGRITDTRGLAEALGSGSVTVTFSISNP